MITERTSDDICLLCKINKADKKGSHFTPVGILKKVVGKRSSEHEVTIDPNKGEVTQYFGRDNLKNTDTTIRQSDNVRDYIFCSDCEKRLGIIESECIEKLNVFSDNLIDNELTIMQTANSNSFFIFHKPHKNIVTLFFYSIIWRQILLDSLLHKAQFPEEFVEELRVIVYHEINKSLTDIEKNDYQKFPKLIIYTTHHNNADQTGFTYGPNPYHSNPEVFSIGIYETLIFLSDAISETFTLTTKLPVSLVDIELVINNSEEGIIGVVDHEIWNTKIKWFFAKAADDFIKTYVKRIVSATHLKFDQAESLLKEETHQIREKTSAKDYGSFFEEAVANVIRKNS